MGQIGGFLTQERVDHATRPCLNRLADWNDIAVPNDDDTQPPLVTWRAHANLLFSNWLNYFVYQETPYLVKTIRAL